jgi:hypothetical protein
MTMNAFLSMMIDLIDCLSTCGCYGGVHDLIQVRSSRLSGIVGQLVHLLIHVIRH